MLQMCSQGFALRLHSAPFQGFGPPKDRFTYMVFAKNALEDNYFIDSFIH